MELNKLHLRWPFDFTGGIFIPPWDFRSQLVVYPKFILKLLSFGASLPIKNVYFLPFGTVVSFPGISSSLFKDT